MNKLARTILLRNILEIGVLIALLNFFLSKQNINFLSILPIALILPVFVYDFYMLYNFIIHKDHDGLLKFESRLLFYSFAWYFIPAFVSILLILKNQRALNLGSVLIIALIYSCLYFYNYKTSKKLLAQISIA